MYKIKTKGNNHGGFSSLQGGWSQYSKPIKRDDKAENVKVETNKQIAKDSRPVNDKLKPSTTTIDTTDREEREAFKDMMPPEKNNE